MKGYELTTGQTIMHEGRPGYIKTLSFTMGNVIHLTLRREGGGLEKVQILTEQDVEVVR